MDRLDGADAEKPTLVFFANAGREASDFNGLAAQLNAENHPVEPIEAPTLTVRCRRLRRQSCLIWPATLDPDHAMLPEPPDAIAQAILTWLTALPEKEPSECLVLRLNG